MTSELPTYARQWVQQWIEAAPRLQAIRDEELRRLDDPKGPGIPEAKLYDNRPDLHGMVSMQRWLVRKHLLDLKSKGLDV